MYFLMASFLGYFYYYSQLLFSCFLMFSIADLNAVFVEDLLKWWFLAKDLSSRLKKYLPIFVDTFLLKGG